MNKFGKVVWEDWDIEIAFENFDIDYDEGDIATIREMCCNRLYGIQDAMTAAGWEYIYNAIQNYTREKEAIERRAREEGLR